MGQRGWSIAALSLVCGLHALIALTPRSPSYFPAKRATHPMFYSAR